MDKCIVCGAVAVKDYKGYLFCLEHQHFDRIDPEKLESIVLLRFQGKSNKEIEKYLEGLI